MEEFRKKAVEEDADPDLDTSAILDKYLQKNLAEVRMNPVVYGSMDYVTHSAGYRSAEENILEANNDAELINKGRDRLWSEYNLKNYVRDAVDMIMNPEQ